ncbi:MAG: ion transporter, partial [Gemmataceae bacterium]
MTHEADATKPVEVANLSRAEIENEVDGLEQRLHRLRGSRSVHSEEAAAELQAIEFRLRELAVALSRIENDISTAELQSILPDVRDWAEVAESLELNETVHAARKLGHELAIERAESWRQTVAKLGEAPTPDQCFNALLVTSGLEFEVLGHEAREHSDIPVLAELRGELREKFLRSLETAAATTDQRERWTEALADRSEALLSALPDYSPRRASTHLDLLSADVRWHLDHVECQKGPRRTRLERKYRRLRAEWQERVLQTRLEGTFGRTLVGWFERLILVLIFAVLGLLVFEWVRDPEEGSELLFWLTMVDTAICAVFLWEFFFKLWLAPERGRWFYRHFLIDLIPSIPFGLLHLHAADSLRAGRLARFLRLPRLARYLRVARPIIRVFRVYGFLARGLDRLARQYSNLLNRNIVLYPTRAERQEAQRLSQSLPRRLRRLRAGVNGRWRHVLLSSNRRERNIVAQARLEPLRQAYQGGLVRFDVGAEQVVVAHDMPADMLIRRLGTMNAQEIQAELGDDLTRRLARIVRLLARAPFRWFPILSSIVPRLSRHYTDADTVSAAARRLCATLARYYNRWFWTADLYGTITPSQFVDRLGSVLVRGGLRPAYRLTLFGLAFLLVEAILSLFRLDILEPIEKMLYQFLGLPIVALGAVCYLIVLIGFWLQRMAREATEFYERAADAQFLALMEIIRSRFFERDSRIFATRVLHPERQVQQGQEATPIEADEQDFAARIQAWLVGAHMKGGEAHLPFDPVERTLLLYRDSLDGALLVDSDTRTTNQLLGNPALHRYEALSRRFNRREAKQLAKLDLQRQTSFSGPYVWFNLITRVIAHSAARLIIDYNRHALPRAELARANATEKERFQTWLAAERTSFTADDEPAMGSEADPRVITTAFTVLHFLDDDPQRDHEVEERFGPEVLKRLQHDRRLLMRRVFGTYPFHHLPREMRVLNLHVLYENWLAGGRAVFLPVLVCWRLFGQVGTLWAWLKRSLRELR